MRKRKRFGNPVLSLVPNKIESAPVKQEEDLLEDVVTAAAVFVAVEDLFNEEAAAYIPTKEISVSITPEEGDFGGGGASDSF